MYKNTGEAAGEQKPPEGGEEPKTEEGEYKEK